MPTRPFHVYALLYDEKHLEPSAREEGLSVLISMQSMMIRVRGYNNLKEFGIFFIYLLSAWPNVDAS